MSYEQPNPKTDIMVQCRNKLCDEFGRPKWFPPELMMADGERIFCGGCGHETRFIGKNRPKRDKEWSAGMNGVLPTMNFEDGSSELSDGESA